MQNISTTEFMISLWAVGAVLAFFLYVSLAIRDLGRGENWVIIAVAMLVVSVGSWLSLLAPPIHSIYKDYKLEKSLNDKSTKR